MNRDTEHIFYNQRIIIDAKVETEPRAWRVSKINRVTPYGVAMTTLAQDHFDQNKDYIEKDDNGNIVGMWADYFESGITPINPDSIKPSSIYSKVSFNGSSKVYIGKSKTFKVTFYDSTGEIVIQPGSWNIISEKTYKDFNGNEHYINEYLHINYSVDNSEIEVSFVPSDEINIWTGESLLIEYITADNSIVSSASVVLKG